MFLRIALILTVSLVSLAAANAQNPVAGPMRDVIQIMRTDEGRETLDRRPSGRFRESQGSRAKQMTTSM